MRFFRILTLTACLASLSSLASAAPITKEFLDRDFGWVTTPTPALLNTWETSTLIQTGGATGNTSTLISGGKPSPGEPESAYRSIGTSFPSLSPGASATILFALINNTFSWNPATDGLAGQMEFRFDLRTFEASFSTFGLFYRPILRQDGTIYRTSTTIAQVQAPPVGDWSANPFQFVFDSMNVWDRGGSSPNFSAAGSPIAFGFEVGLTASCPTGGTNCSAAFSTNGIDNYFVRVTEASEPGPSAIPEPATVLTLSAALAGLALLRKR